MIAVLQRWQAQGGEEIDWITGHALRGLLKAGNPDALELLGYPPNPAIAPLMTSAETSPRLTLIPAFSAAEEFRPIARIS